MHAHKQWYCYNLHWSLYFTVYINSKSHTEGDAWDSVYYACVWDFVSMPLHVKVIPL